MSDIEKAMSLDAAICVHCGSDRLRPSRGGTSAAAAAQGLKHYRCLACQELTPLPERLQAEVKPHSADDEGTGRKRRVRRKRSAESTESPETRERSVSIRIGGRRHDVDLAIYALVALVLAATVAVSSEDWSHGLIAGTTAVLVWASISIGLGAWGGGVPGALRRAIFMGLLPVALIGGAFWMVRAPQWRQEAAARELVQQAQGHLGGARLPEAADAFSRALDLHPALPDALFGLGVTRQRQGQAAEAERLLREAATLSPENVAILTALGQQLADGGRAADGLRYCQQAVNLAPDDGAAHLCMGRLLTASARHDEAVRAYRQAVALKPAEPTAHEGLGWALLGTVEALESNPLAAPPTTPTPAPPSASLPAAATAGSLLPLSGTVDKTRLATDALTSFREAVRLDGRSASAHHGAGRALLVLGEKLSARIELEESLKLQPDSAEVSRALGTLLLSAGETEPGLAALRKATQASRPDARSWNVLADALERLGRGPAAAEARLEARKLSTASGSAATTDPAASTVNRPPAVARLSVNRSVVAAGDPVSVSFTIEDPDADALTWSASVQGGGGGSLQSNFGGPLPSGSFVTTVLATREPATARVVITVKDVRGAASTAQIDVTAR